MRVVFPAVIVLLGLLLTGTRADATVIVLQSPSIRFKADVDKKLADAIHAVVQDKQYQFLGGGHGMGWGPEHECTNLFYSGDAKSLDSFFTRLSRIKGLQVTIRLTRDLPLTCWNDEGRAKVAAIFDVNITPPTPSWEVVQSRPTPERLEVWINLSAKEISVEQLLEKWLRERAGANLSGTPVVASPSPRSQPPARTTGLTNEIQGTWRLESRIVQGKKLDDQPGMQLVVSETTMKIIRVDGSKPSVTLLQEYYRIDATKDPAQIDTTGKTDWTDVDEGICKFEKDTLTLCFAGRKKPRPTNFATGEDAGMGHLLMVFKRVDGGPAADQGLRGETIRALQTALEAEKDARVRLLTAESLIRLDPNNKVAARELVAALTGNQYDADAYLILEKVIPDAPPAVVRALLPVLGDANATNRQRAAVLFGKIKVAKLP